MVSVLIASMAGHDDTAIREVEALLEEPMSAPLFQRLERFVLHPKKPE